MQFEGSVEENLREIAKGQELALFFDGDSTWRLSVGNSSAVLLGEVEGDMEATGKSIGEVIVNMRLQLEKRCVQS